MNPSRFFASAGALLHHPGVGFYGRNLVWIFAERAVRLFFGFAVGVYVARRLGPANFGELSCALSVVALFAVPAALGLDSIVIRELVNRPLERDRLLGTAFCLKLGGFVLLAAGITAFIAFSGFGAPEAPLIALIASGYVFQPLDVLDFNYQAQVMAVYPALSRIIALALVSLLRLYCAWKRLPLACFAALEALYLLLQAAGYLAFCRRSGTRPAAWRFDARLAKSLLSDSWPILVSTAAVTVYMRIDQLFLKYLLGDAELGVYAAAQRLTELFFFIGAAFQSTLFPAVLRARRISQEHYEMRLRYFFGAMLYFHLLLALALTAGAGLLTGLYGSSFAAARPLFAILLWRIVFIAAGTASGSYYFAENLQRDALWFSLEAMAVNIALNWILIPRFGAAGAAWSAVICAMGIVYLLPLTRRATRPLVRLQLGGADPRIFWDLLQRSAGNDGGKR